MNPLIMGFGMAAQLAGGILGMQNASWQAQLGEKQAQISASSAADQAQINSQKQQQMVLQAQRSQLENFRNTQRARAQGLNSAVQGGAQFGSGFSGGQAQITDEGNTNAVGINQNYQIGSKIAGYNQDISNNNQYSAAIQSQQSDAQGKAATFAGLSSLGGALIKDGPTIGNIVKSGPGIFSNLFS